MILLPHLANVRCVMMISNEDLFSFRPYFVQYCFFDFQPSSSTVHSSDNSSMSNTTKTTYMASFPKRNDITGAPDQVFKFDNFLDNLMGGIKANIIAAIRTINPGSLCLQYLYAPQVHCNLSDEPIAFIGNSSNKKGKFSMININVKSIRVFPYIKDKATWDTNLTHRDNIPPE